MNKKYGSISVKASENRKLYDKLRYEIAVKPYWKSKKQVTTKIIYQCPFCGKSSSAGCFDKPFLTKIGLLFYRGRANIQYRNAINIHPIYRGKIQDFLEQISKRAVAFLKMALSDKYITKEKIIELLDLVVIEKIEEVDNLWQPKKIRNVQDMTNGGTVSNTPLLEISLLCPSVKKLKSVTPSWLRKPERILKS